jgi:hypothetical protein
MAYIATNLSRFHPMSMAIGHDGASYYANGLDAPRRWDGQSSLAEDAGVRPPSTTVTIAAQSTAGTIWGNYIAYCRFVDDGGVPSNLSPVTSIAITSGAANTGFVYTNVPQPTARADKTEIWRNTRGQTVTLYRDVADAAATARTARTDGELVLQQSLRILSREGWPNANRFSQPPDWASVVVSFQNRTWWGVPVDYDFGTATLSTSTTNVQFTGTKLTSQMAGRNLSGSGFQAAEISSVDSNTSVTLVSAPVAGFGSAGDYYAICTDPANYNTILFSEAGEPESVPAENALTLQEDGDRLRAQMPLGAYLYLLKERHLYRLSTAGDPRRDAIAMLVGRRGCLNQRSWCRIQRAAFVLDRQGAYMFDGSAPVPISSAVDDPYFRSRVNWDAARWFHVEHAPDEFTVRCFVALDHDWWPRDVLAFNYQLGQWSHERYPFELGASVQVPINGQDRTLVGMEETVSLLSEGVLDGPSPGLGSHDETLPSVTGTTRGTITSAGTTTIIDTAASFDFTFWHASPQSIGAPVYVIDANGDYQMRRIASIDVTTSTITFQHAFSTTPSVGETYQIGGRELEGKFGAFALPEGEQEQTRRVLMRFEPQTQAGKINLRHYYNHTSVAETAHVAYDDNVGVNVEADSPNAQFDLSQAEGVLQTRFDAGYDPQSPANRSLEIELNGVSGNVIGKIYQVQLDGVTR